MLLIVWFKEQMVTIYCSLAVRELIVGGCVIQQMLLCRVIKCILLIMVTSVYQWTNGKFCKSIWFWSVTVGVPSDVTVDADNHLLIDDYTNSCIYIFTLDGGYIGKCGSPGSGRNQLYRPHCLTTALNGYILVSDTGNHRISIFNKDGNCMAAMDLRMASLIILVV